MSTKSIAIQTAGLTVSRLAWDLYQSTATNVVERIYSLNPGLGKRGLFLPIGTTVIVDIAPPAPQTAREIIKLWD